jgi:hypothetical protein
VWKQLGCVGLDLAKYLVAINKYCKIFYLLNIWIPIYFVFPIEWFPEPSIAKYMDIIPYISNYID